MNKILLIVIFLGLFTLQSCNKKEGAKNSSTIAETGMSGSTAKGEEAQPGPLKLEIGSIKTLEFNKQYLISGGEKTYSLKIIPHMSAQYPIVEFNIDGSPFDFENEFDTLTSALCYMGPNGIYRIMLCGERGNDYHLIGNYKITDTGVEKEGEITGEIKEIDANGAMKVESRQFLAGFQMLTAVYNISEHGQMVREGDYEISSGGANNGSGRFTLVKDIKVNLYEPADGTYKAATVSAGEGLTLERTNMKDRLYFKTDSGEKGYIEIVFINSNEGFSVDGTNLTDYFNKSELSWAG